ncbi:hypothetical protein [Bradyrhizobium erythrophlei]|uniref:hypothetical protein n=1 Tax=Bradyrhizobium erythrophlei TaxID=1437360 RepID=UPI0012EB915D|nr:hypothetical protein [Bradyrhizobium erythrophlei]
MRDGIKIVNASEVSVDHIGVRKHGEESRKLIRGTGAALFKHIRMGDIAALKVYLRFVAANTRRACANLVRARRKGTATRAFAANMEANAVRQLAGTVQSSSMIATIAPLVFRVAHGERHWAHS